VPHGHAEARTRGGHSERAVRVLIVGPYAPDGQVSIPAFVSTLMAGLAPLGHDVSSCSPNPTRFGKALKPMLGRRALFIDKFVLFPRALKRLASQYDLIHIAEHGYASYGRVVRDRPHVITCHDLIVAKAALGLIPNWPLSYPAKRYQHSILNNLRGSRHVVAVSGATRRDVIDLAGVPESRCSLVLNGFYRPSQRVSTGVEAELRNFGIPVGAPWFLHVGGNQENKNRKGLVEIFGALKKREQTKDHHLVMAGAQPGDPVLQAIRALDAPGDVHLVVRPTDRQIMMLYSSATALLYPSLYEGFGLPIIEAQACGCPVITTRGEPMMEVAGEAAIFIDPGDIEGSANDIAKSVETLGSLVSRGYVNATRFSAENMCQGYSEVYARVAS